MARWQYFLFGGLGIVQFVVIIALFGRINHEECIPMEEQQTMYTIAEIEDVNVPHAPPTECLPCDESELMGETEGVGNGNAEKVVENDLLTSEGLETTETLGDTLFDDEYPGLETENLEHEEGVKGTTMDTAEQTTTYDVGPPTVSPTGDEADAWFNSVSNSWEDDVRIYVYPVPNTLLFDTLRIDDIWSGTGWCMKDTVFKLEMFFPLMVKNSRFYTDDPSQATFFLIPHASVCYYHIENILFGREEDYFTHPLMREHLDPIIDWVQQEYPYFNASGGLDHVIVASHEFAYRAIRGEKRLDEVIALTNRGVMRNSEFYSTPQITFGTMNQQDIILMPFFNPKQSPAGDLFGIPIESRTVKAYFRGRIEFEDNPIYSRGCRKKLKNYVSEHGLDREDHPLAKKSDAEIGEGHSTTVLQPPVIFESTSSNFGEYNTEMRNSIFCFHVSGWMPWSTRITHIVYYDCIPVIIADEGILPFEQIIDWSAFTLKFSDVDCDVEKIFDTLLTMPEAEIMQKYENFQRIRHKLIFNKIPAEDDAFHQIMKLLTRKAWKYGLALFKEWV